jgi:hypothetical protein
MEQDKHDKELKALEKEKKQISILNSGNSKAIISTLEEIRKKGQISILPDIFELMLVTEEEVFAKCTSLLCDLKTPDAKSLLLSALQDEKYFPIRNFLVSACWQNGMDYHEEIQLFAEIVLKDNYITAIEAFTLIENSIGELEDSAIIKLIDTLKLGLNSMEEEKKLLVTELINLIKSY